MLRQFKGVVELIEAGSEFECQRDQRRGRAAAKVGFVEKEKAWKA